MLKEESIFHRYYSEEKFIDRKITSDEEAVDVIIPITNTNELFEKNLISAFREIPINRLLIGNGGSTDDSLDILKKFPRVEIIDQTKRKTLGYCIAELISLVETDWFIYLHSDVYLPKNWYDKMKENKGNYDWFESDSRHTTLIKYDAGIKYAKRSYSGGQMGRKEAFKEIILKIDDDYLYRNEDIVIKDLIEQKGFKWGRVLETQYFHQFMEKKTGEELKFRIVDIRVFEEKQREIDVLRGQIKGIIKYCSPKPYLIRELNDPILILKRYNALNTDEFIKWVKKTNNIWLDYLDLGEINPPPNLIQKIYRRMMKILRPLLKKIT